MKILFVCLAFGLENCSGCIASTIHPQAEEHLHFAAQYYQNGQLEEAEARTRIAIEFSPKYAEAYNQLGLIEYSRGHQDLAMEHFKQAVSLKDDFAEVHNNIGAIFLDRREYGPACDEFKESIRVDPGFLSARQNYATCLMWKGDPDEARDQYLRCVQINPDACDCHLGLGAIANARERFDESRLHFQKVIQACPDRPEGHYNLCWAEMKLGHCALAINECVIALAQRPEYIEARQNLTEAYQCVSMSDKVLERYMSEIKKNPGSPEPHYNLGALYEEKGSLVDSLNEFLNCTKFDDQHELCHYRAAVIYDRLLKSDETISMCQKFMDLLRDNRFIKEKTWCVDRIKNLQLQ